MQQITAWIQMEIMMIVLVEAIPVEVQLVEALPVEVIVKILEMVWVEYGMTLMDLNLIVHGMLLELTAHLMEMHMKILDILLMKHVVFVGEVQLVEALVEVLVEVLEVILMDHQLI